MLRWPPRSGTRAPAQRLRGNKAVREPDSESVNRGLGVWTFGFGRVRMWAWACGHFGVSVWTFGPGPGRVDIRAWARGHLGLI
eukprot:12965508-Alexandrium_andersonii.AAC.1